MVSPGENGDLTRRDGSSDGSMFNDHGTSSEDRRWESEALLAKDAAAKVKMLPERSSAKTPSNSLLTISRITDPKTHKEQKKREDSDMVGHHKSVVIGRFDDQPPSGLSDIPRTAILENIRIHFLSREDEIPTSAEIEGITSEDGHGSGETRLD